MSNENNEGAVLDVEGRIEWVSSVKGFVSQFSVKCDKNGSACFQVPESQKIMSYALIAGQTVMVRHSGISGTEPVQAVRIYNRSDDAVLL